MCVNGGKESKHDIINNINTLKNFPILVKFCNINLQDYENDSYVYL